MIAIVSREVKEGGGIPSSQAVDAAWHEPIGLWLSSCNSNMSKDVLRGIPVGYQVVGRGINRLNDTNCGVSQDLNQVM